MGTDDSGDKAGDEGGTKGLARTGQMCKSLQRRREDGQTVVTPG